MSRLSATVAGLVALSVPTTLLAAPPLFGVMFRTGGQTAGLYPNLYDINPSTGAATNPRPVNVNNTVGLAIDPVTGIMYGLTDQLGRINNQTGLAGKNLLFTIDPVSGFATGVGTITPSAGPLQVFEGDLAFSPTDGQLYATRSLNGVGTLLRIDIHTPANSVAIGDINAPNFDASAMAFAPNGDLYVLNTTIPAATTTPAQLFKINPANAQVLQSWQLDLAIGTVAGMAFHPDSGDLLVVDGDFAGLNQMFRVDFANSALAPIGATGAAGGNYQGLAGLAFGYVPEPTSAVAVFVATGAALSRRRRG